MSQGIILVILKRDGYGTQWGFRLHGGKDIGYPLTIQKVQLGSPSQNELYRGDIVLGINDVDATGLSHMEAHDIIKTTGNQLRLLVHRFPQAPQTPYTPAATKINIHPLASSIPSTIKQSALTHPSSPKVQSYEPRTWTPPQLPTSPIVSGFQPVNPPKFQKVEKSKAKTPPYFMQKLPSKNFTPTPNMNRSFQPTPNMNKSFQPAPNINKSFQPAPNMNKCFQPTPLSDDKPKFVNLQYNSPLGLYSKESLAETLNAHTAIQPKCRSKSPLPIITTKQSPMPNEDPGSPSLSTPSALSPARPGTKLTNIVDITLSPTFQMIQEAENRSNSPRPGSKTPPPIKYSPPTSFIRYPSNCYQDPTVNAFGSPREAIHQSGSFKTLMATLTLSDGQDL